MTTPTLREAAPTGGSPEHLLQDQSRDLSLALAGKPDAPMRAREAAALQAAWNEGFKHGQWQATHCAAHPQQPAPLTDAYEQAAEQIVGRYIVEKRSGGGFWPYCVRAVGGTMELFIGHKTKCEEVAQALQTACLDGAFMVKQAALGIVPAPTTESQPQR
jgi:hypothetical protein